MTDANDTMQLLRKVVREEVADLRADMRVIVREGTADLRQELGDLHQEVNDLHRQVSGIHQEVGSLQQEVGGLHKTVQGETVRLWANIKALQEDTQALRQVQGQQSNLLRTIQSNLGGLKNSFRTQARELHKLGVLFEDLDHRFQTGNELY